MERTFGPGSLAFLSRYPYPPKNWKEARAYYDEFLRRFGIPGDFDRYVEFFYDKDNTIAFLDFIELKHQK